MKMEKEFLFLGIGLCLSGITMIISNTKTGSAVLIAYAIGAMIRDKQHTGEWFP